MSAKTLVQPQRTKYRLPPLKTETDSPQRDSPQRVRTASKRSSPQRSSPQASHARNHLAAAQYFEQQDVRGLFTTLTQMLMIHQPANAQVFLHEQLGKMIGEQEEARDVKYGSAVADGACLVRVQAEYLGPDGKRKETFTRLVPSDESMMRRSAEDAAAATIHSVFWANSEAPKRKQMPESPRAAHEARLAEIAQEERDLAKERRLIELHTKASSAAMRRRVQLGSPACSPRSRATSSHGILDRSSSPSASAPNLSGYETGVLMCTYAAQGWRAQLEDLIRNGVPVDTGDYDKRTALHLAASEGHVEVVEMLLYYGANVNATDRMGFSPLVDACRHCHYQIQNMLRAAGGQLLGMDVSVAIAEEFNSSKSKAFFQQEKDSGWRDGQGVARGIAVGSNDPSLPGALLRNALARTASHDSGAQKQGGSSSSGGGGSGSGGVGRRLLSSARMFVVERLFVVARQFTSLPLFRDTGPKQLAGAQPQEQEGAGAEGGVGGEAVTRGEGGRSQGGREAWEDDAVVEEKRSVSCLPWAVEDKGMASPGERGFGPGPRLHSQARFMDKGPRYTSSRRF